jgi:hypothetical protein
MYQHLSRRLCSRSASATLAGIFAWLGSIGSLAACRQAAPPLGGTVPEARANADVLFGSLAARWVNVERHPKFEKGRNKLGRYALSPSGVINDTSVWTSSQDSTRALSLRAALTANRYVFTPERAAPVPEQPGASRHVIQLRWLGQSDYEWQTTVDQNIGPVTPDEIAGVISAFLVGGEGLSEPIVRAEYRAAFPRATRTLGLLFALDSVRPTHLADGSTALTLGVRLHPERLAPTMPNFAKYIEKYVGPARFRVTVRDARGVDWVDVRGDDDFVTVRLRSKGGSLAPLSGPLRPLPDSLRLRVDFIGKFLFFDVGFTGLDGDFLITRRAGERAWTARFREEPKWKLPLATSHFIRAPLRRPFEGNGSVVVLAVREGPNGQTVLHRLARTTVRESAIVRWIGGLGFTAMNDFAGKAEVEENRFNAQALYALRADMIALLGGTPDTTTGEQSSR